MSTSQNEFKYPHYHKNGTSKVYVDVYRVIELFDVKDHAIGHAIKNCCAVVNAAQKTKHKTLQEAISSLLRYLEMQTENENEK